MEERSLKEWLEQYKAGAFDSKNVGTQCDAGWYDWFCCDTSLAGRLKKMAPKVQQIAKSKKIDTEKTYVWFKNNCPFDGKLYDDFRIADIETGDTIYCVTPEEGFTRSFGKSSVWGRENNFSGPLAIGSWECVLNFFFPDDTDTECNG